MIRKCIISAEEVVKSYIDNNNNVVFEVEVKHIHLDEVFNMLNIELKDQGVNKRTTDNCVIAVSEAINKELLFDTIKKCITVE